MKQGTCDKPATEMCKLRFRINQCYEQTVTNKQIKLTYSLDFLLNRFQPQSFGHLADG